MASRRDAANRWSARHPFRVGLVAGLTATLFFVASYNYDGVSGISISFAAFWAIGTLTALAERRRRKKHNLPL